MSGAFGLQYVLAKSMKFHFHVIKNNNLCFWPQVVAERVNSTIYIGSTIIIWHANSLQSSSWLSRKAHWPPVQTSDFLWLISCSLQSMCSAQSQFFLEINEKWTAASICCQIYLAVLHAWPSNNNNASLLHHHLLSAPRLFPLSNVHQLGTKHITITDCFVISADVDLGDYKIRICFSNLWSPFHKSLCTHHSAIFMHTPLSYLCR